MPSERIRIGDDYYLLASALAPRGPRLVLSHGDSFAVLDESGDMPLAGHEAAGLFHRDTRFLARFELRIDGELPLLLNAALSDDASELVVYLTNNDQRRGGEIAVQRDTVALLRRTVLADAALFETWTLRNYGSTRTTLHLTLLFEADFADVFELRGIDAGGRGELSSPSVDGGAVRIGYLGRDGIRRTTELRFGPSRWRLTPERGELDVELEPGAETSASVAVFCRVADGAVAPVDAAQALTRLRGERRECLEWFPRIASSREAYDQWLRGSVRDLALLRAVRPTGSYVQAGSPWFATVFGRDGLLTGFATLAFAPELSAGTLRTLAALQGRENDPARDEEPGKIVHECRSGELANIGAIPFGRYYGSVDATPLFVALLGAYADRTADLDLARELWPAAIAAMQWIDRSLDGRGYLAYQRRTPKGLINQGWKDSHDAISHADGRLAEPPIALAEVQGYVYAARRALAGLARRLGHPGEADAWEREAASLAERFARDFWCPGEDVYAIALDGAGQPCRVVNSNTGHCLFAGIADRERAARVVARLMREDCFCGWGVRTLSARERRYNPMSYHNGSVWPHDNAVIAAGFARYGFTGRAAELLTALFDASQELEDRRLPELFCGFDRSERQQPVPYPVACRPQAWAAASAFLLLQAALGLSIDAWKRRVTFTQTMLPSWLDHLEIRGLRVREARLDLRMTRGRRGAAVEILGKEGDVDVVVRQ
jgi:glycogen debranching enzyme